MTLSGLCGAGLAGLGNSGFPSCSLTGKKEKLGKRVSICDGSGLLGCSTGCWGLLGGGGGGLLVVGGGLLVVGGGGGLLRGVGVVALGGGKGAWVWGLNLVKGTLDGAVVCSRGKSSSYSYS